ncbi:hypothetical protein HDU83_002897 [Entophlyctis luteolus]|nr:hypothetical protein HDU83_002897 [Entophlyctis luteolus]
MPAISIRTIQRLVERAWRLGFDPDGAQQLRHSLVGSRKHIGAGEVYALFHSLGVKVLVSDFVRCPHRMIDYFEDYFTRCQSSANRLPLYLQYQGHSICVTGLRRLNAGRIIVAIDPARRGIRPKGSRRKLRGIVAFREDLIDPIRSFQVVQVEGPFTADDDIEEYKMFKSQRYC